MPFSAPPDNSKAVLAVAVGLSLAVITFALTRNNLPQVGDNIHSLPHGGCYSDGTKRISYFAPQEKFPSSNLLKTSNSPVIILSILGLSILIYLSSKFSTKCQICGREGCEGNATGRS
uniref:Movement protein TGB2 n=1 Tax=Carrot carlavirus WM-2008 TaxID=552517 RepID=B5AZR5_9VIRU|nr:triple gene block protein 2 [Carrot carlavirus WM-2008]